MKPTAVHPLVFGRLPLLAAACFALFGNASAQTAAAGAKKDTPAATSTVTADASKEALPAIKPNEDELNASYLDKPTDKVKAVLEAYTAGKFDDARKQAEPLAKDGDLNAKFILALCQQNGRGGAASLPEAERLFREAADKGHVAAKVNLAYLLYATAGQDKDRLADAIRGFKDAVTTSPARVALTLGELYARGLGVTADFDEAEKYFDTGLKAGQQRGLLAKGLLYDGSFGFEKRKDVAKAEGFYKQAADAGQIDAMIVLGRKKLAASEGKNAGLIDEGLKWLEKAGEKGNGEAYLALGMAYEDGSVVKKDEAKAFGYYKKGEALGFPAAIAKVGSCQENGIGTDKDPKAAFASYKSAADRGLPLAIYNVAVAYDQGIGVDKSSTSAFRAYLQAAQANFALGMNAVAERYLTGSGTTQDVVAAAGWFGLAAQNGSVAAALSLARMSLQGVGVPRNLQTAVQLYGAAVNGGSGDAAFELGQIFEIGVNNQRDLARAHALYSMAVDAKVEKAAERRDEVAKNMSKDQLEAATLIRKGLPGLAPAKDAGKEGAKDAPKDDKKPAAGKTK